MNGNWEYYTCHDNQNDQIKDYIPPNDICLSIDHTIAETDDDVNRIIDKWCGSDPTLSNGAIGVNFFRDINRLDNHLKTSATSKTISVSECLLMGVKICSLPKEEILSYDGWEFVRGDHGDILRHHGQYFTFNIEANSMFYNTHNRRCFDLIDRNYGHSITKCPRSISHVIICKHPKYQKTTFSGIFLYPKNVRFWFVVDLESWNIIDSILINKNSVILDEP